METGEQRPTWLVVTVQFFVVPMLIVALCVGLVMVFRWMTFERRDVTSYLSALRASPSELGARGLLNYIEESKRWQGIFDMTQELNGRRAELLREDPALAKKLLIIFEEAGARGDWKVRQYLALVLGMVGDKAAVPALLDAAEPRAQNSQDGTHIAAMKALAMMEDERALPVLLRLARSNERAVRLTAAWALGSFPSAETDAVLRVALGDDDPFVRWNAALALARHGQPEAAPVLEQLVEADYLAKRAPLPTAEERGDYRVAAVTLLGNLKIAKQDALFDKLSREDADYRVRQAAIAVLKARKTKKP
ncbi:MAG: HEAT repeat domain-containing protein [Verrucomicrobia bacterium]|nr:HEAT repeat domain-containing protein [Verrucomicrobiota bacterium]